MGYKISLNIRKRFVKDYNLPIKLYDDEMFNYYIDLYDGLHQTKHKYLLLEQAVTTFRGEDGFLKEFNSIKDEIIADVSSKAAYKKLANLQPITLYEHKNQIPKQNIYIPDFNDRFVISIDLRKANFNSMKYFDPSLVNDAETYEDFISKYTTQSYLIKSKQLRQVIFGNLLPKKQQGIQKSIIHMICDSLLRTLDVRLANAGDDEILVLDTDIKAINSPGNPVRDRPSDILMKLMQRIPSSLLKLVKIRRFKLKHVHPQKPFYMKVYGNGEVELKNVPAVYYPQVYKHIFKQPIEDKDLMFEYEGERAAFVNPLYPENIT